MQLYQLYLRGSNQAQLNEGELERILRNRWNATNEQELMRLPWTLSFVNSTGGVIDREGRPVLIVYYSVALPNGYDVMASLREPLYRTLRSDVRTLRFILVRSNQVYTPEYRYMVAIPGRLSNSEAVRVLVSAWQQVHQGKPNAPSTIRVYVVRSEPAIDSHGQATSKITYFLSFNNRIVHPSAILPSDMSTFVSIVTGTATTVSPTPSTLSTTLEPSTTTEIPVTPQNIILQYETNITGDFTPQDFNETAIVTVIKKAWENLNPGRYRL